MCGIAGILNLKQAKIERMQKKLDVMNELLAHRGPDDNGTWKSKDEHIGLAHQRLTIIDLSAQGHQPMIGEDGNIIAFNGEIYNHIELREQLKDGWNFKSSSDTEVILAAYQKWGADCLTHLRGMFAFVIWDGEKLFCARDRFGIKPFYYTIVDEVFYFASEAKALIPFLNSIDIDEKAFAEYITFQYPISQRTLFKGVHQLLPGHMLFAKQGGIHIQRYWDVSFDIDFDHSASYYEQRLDELLKDSIAVHLRSDVPVGCYVSGGVDSSLISVLATQHTGHAMPFFNGRFTYGKGYDESHYAREVAQQCGTKLECIDITAQDFEDVIQKVIYHLDYPVAGPGSFPQYMVSKLVSQHVKVVLGGQGGDEIFGGYARYVLAYFEQAINAAIDGTHKDGNFVVTPESIIPNLQVLKEYKPLMKQFWSNGLFDKIDKRYYSLVNRAADFKDEVDWNALDFDYVFEEFSAIFNNPSNVAKASYFDKMTHFDFKCLLPGLLQVEDRVSMAHGVEARVPLLDHKLVEFAATIPADVKFEGGKMKHLLKNTFSHYIPESIANRKDKMGFPVPLNEWIKDDLKDLVFDIFNTGKQKQRQFISYDAVLQHLNETGRFSRKLWAMMSLELWHQAFCDKFTDFRNMIK